MPHSRPLAPASPAAPTLTVEPADCLPDRCQSVRQLARHWRCAPSRVRQLIKRGVLRAFAPGKSVRISPEAVAEAERLLAVPAAGRRRKRADAGIAAEVAALLEAGE